MGTNGNSKVIRNNNTTPTDNGASKCSRNLQSHTEGVDTGQQRRPGGTAVGWGVGGGKANALRVQPLDGGRAELRHSPEAQLHVIVTYVIHQNEENVGIGNDLGVRTGFSFAFAIAFSTFALSLATVAFAPFATAFATPFATAFAFSFSTAFAFAFATAFVTVTQCAQDETDQQEEEE